MELLRVGEYLDKFKERTGYEFIDVYYHYYKLDEEREAKEANIIEKNDDETIGSENIDTVDLKDKKEDTSDEKLIRKNSWME